MNNQTQTTNRLHFEDLDWRHFEQLSYEILYREKKWKKRDPMGLKGNDNGKIDYETFCREFQELSWMDGKRTPLDGKRLRMYIASMREVVDFYKSLL